MAFLDQAIPTVLGALLTQADMVSDLIVVAGLLDQGRIGFATALIATISVNLALQTVMTILQNRKKSRLLLPASCCWSTRRSHQLCTCTAS